jgi:autotransporter-associated beta strand protein
VLFGSSSSAAQNQTYSGDTTINGGTLKLGGSSKFSSSGSLVVGAAGTLDVNGFGQTFAGLSGTCIVTNSQGTESFFYVDIASGASSVFSGTLTGSTLRLGKNGAGTLQLAGSTSNTMTANTSVNAGILVLNKSDGAIAIGGKLYVGGSGGAADSVIARWLQSDQVDTGKSLNGSGADALFDLNGYNQTINAIELYGGEVRTGSGTLTLSSSLRENSGNSTSQINGKLVLSSGTHAILATSGSAAVSMDIPAVISGTGGLEKGSAGVAQLSGDNTYAGTTTVTAGTLRVNGSHSGSGVFTVKTGATLSGTGSIAAAVTVENGGKLDAGTTTSTEDLATGNLSIAGTLAAQVNGATAGAAASGYDQIKVTGTVTLSGALTLSGTHTPVAGNSFKLIDNDGTADAVTGTFTDLAEGATVTVNGVDMAISYRGGDGNDVVVSLPSNNIAPVLDNTVTVTLNDVAYAAGDPTPFVGTMVSELVSLLVNTDSLIEPNAEASVGLLTAPGANVIDADDGADTGIALTATDNTNGTWYYTTDGSTWTAVGTVSATSALLLAADNSTYLYFKPNATYSGTITDGITFRAWDTTYGTAGERADTTDNGGTTAFSTATDTGSITVNPQPTLTYSRTTFSEAAANDGSITATCIITLSGDTFNDGSPQAPDLIAPNLAEIGERARPVFAPSVTNVPTGLTASLVRTDATHATLSFTGNATAHANANDIANLTVTFGNGDFVGGNAAVVTNATKSDLIIDFADPAGGGGGGGSEPPATPPDTDGDGISNSTEDGVPSLPPTDGGAAVPGDGNGDGVADKTQDDVTSLSFLYTETAVSNPGNAPKIYVTLVADSHEGQIDTTDDNSATLTQLTQKDAPANKPADIDMPLGQISFTATVSSPGVNETFSLLIDGDIPINGYYKQNAAGAWVNLATAVVTENGKTRLDFAITDGGEFDSNPAPGIIGDPGAPAFKTVTPGAYMQIIEKLYIAYFGRPGDPEGVAYWNALLVANGGNLAPIYSAFYASSEYTALHAGQSNEAMLSSLYQNLFSRAVEPAGMRYWIGEITAGRLTLDKVAFWLVHASSSQDAAVLNNKAVAATTFTAHVDLMPEVNGYLGNGAFNSARTFLSTVKTAVPSDAAIDAAVLAAVTAPPSPYLQMIEKLYVAYFGRPGDPGGMAYWETVLLANGGNLAPIYSAFYASSEYTALHAGQSNEVMIDSLYQNLFSRTAEPAGLTYWAGEITSGRLSLDQVAMALVNGASGLDLTVFTNKLVTATTFSAHVDLPSEIVAYQGASAFGSARTFLATVKTAVPSNPTVDAAVLAAVTAGTPTALSRDDFVTRQAMVSEGDLSAADYGGYGAVTEEVWEPVGLVGLNPAAVPAWA